MGDKLQVVIPKNIKTHQAIRVRCPDKTIVNVVVPDGLGPGDSLVFQVRKNGEASIIGSDQKGANKNGKESNKINDAKDKSNSSDSFWGHEIQTKQDFLLSMGAGFFIGLFIVLGFFAGVLYVTRYFPLPKELQTSAKPVLRTQSTENAHCKQSNPSDNMMISGTQQTQAQSMCRAK